MRIANSIRKNRIELTSEGMLWANTISAEMAMEYLHEGKGELVSLEEKSSKIAKEIMLKRTNIYKKSKI